MRFLIIPIFLLTSFVTLADSNNKLEEIRNVYYQSVEDEKYIDSLTNVITPLLNKKSSDYPIILAYYGAAESVKAKHAFWPFTKMSYLNDSMETLAAAVALDKNNLEIRFIRFSILHYVPAILGYSNELEEDQKKILELLSKNQYSGLPNEIVDGIVNFMIESERLSDAQMNKIKSTRMLSKFD